MNKIFVGGLSWNTNEHALENFFSQIGDISECKVITDRETGRSKGFGFVTFANEEDASRAVERFDGTELDGRNIRVNLAEAKPRRDNDNHFSNRNRY
ncbi:MAG: RNA recognition motif domain-containing protein [Oligoflexales bacterium]